MTHSLKSKVLKLLSKFPETFGDFIYHCIQEKSGNSNVSKKIASVSGSFEIVSKILTDNNISLKDKKIIEIGSGWAPILPYQMILKAKVSNVKSYDINEHYSKRQIRKVNEFYSSYDSFKIAKNSKYNLLDNVEYYPNMNVTNADFKDIDFIFSRFVLEHVPPNVLREMHASFAEKINKDTYILHLISPSDHRAYSDPTLSLHDFLKYSQEEWDSIQTRFDYHNRLRLPHYVEIFTKDFEIVSLEHDEINPKSTAYKKFKNLKIHNDFENYTDQELMAGSINVLLRKR